MYGNSFEERIIEIYQKNSLSRCNFEKQWKRRNIWRPPGAHLMFITIRKMQRLKNNNSQHQAIKRNNNI